MKLHTESSRAKNLTQQEEISFLEPVLIWLQLCWEKQVLEIFQVSRSQMTLFATKLEIQEGFKGAANWKNKVPTIYYLNMCDNRCHEGCEFNKMSLF